MPRKPRKNILTDGPDPIDVYVGNRVRTRRLGLRMSQTKLGDALGITFQQIQKYENGTSRIGASNLYKTANALGVPVSYFFQDYEPDTKIEAQLPDRQALTVMTDFAQISSEKVRKRLAGLVSELAQQSEVA